MEPQEPLSYRGKRRRTRICQKKKKKPCRRTGAAACVLEKRGRAVGWQVPPAEKRPGQGALAAGSPVKCNASRRTISLPIHHRFLRLQPPSWALAPPAPSAAAAVCAQPSINLANGGPAKSISRLQGRTESPGTSGSCPRAASSEDTGTRGTRAGGPLRGLFQRTSSEGPGEVLTRSWPFCQNKAEQKIWSFVFCFFFFH